MRCSYFDAGVCLSCTLMGSDYSVQLAQKNARVAKLFSDFPTLRWLPPMASAESHFRNKAKLVVGGTVSAPTLGILGPSGRGVDLQECGLYEPALAVSFEPLARFITRATLPPFDVATGRGELKNIIVTVSPAGELMVRFVLRSSESIVRIRKHLTWLLDALPQAVVVTANLLPERKAVPEGATEIVLTEAQHLPMRLTKATLNLRPQSFFQTNTAIAQGLYDQAAAWVASMEGPLHLWDLYCGVGGFALSCAGPDRSVLGVEISEQAIASAQTSVADSNLDVRFLVGDALTAASHEEADPDLVIVNPPRRGIGDLADWLDRSPARNVIYSSCNADSLIRDLAQMPHFTPAEARVFDMFPQTNHAETMVLLERVA